MPKPASQLSAENVCVVFCTCPEPASAERVGSALVAEGLAACVNELPGAISTYRWEDQIRRDQEVLLLIKTTRRLLPMLEQRLASLHPYELPELLTVPDCEGSAAYLDWVRANTKADP